MIKFLTFAVKTQLNVHDLNNETGAGNVTDIRVIEFLDEEGKRLEAPAVSGRMLKHWHYEGMKHIIINGSYITVPLCAGCKVGEPIRPSDIIEGKLVQIVKPEADAIASCAVCDIHGYLIAQTKRESTESEKETESELQDETKVTKVRKNEKQESGVSARRNSRAMFSWLMPVLNAETAQKQVIHTRVSQQQEMAAGEAAAQMIFNKSYASGIYAFVSALDIERIGLVDSYLGKENPYAIDDNKGRRDRIKVAIEAYRLMLSGQLGASLSHALPHHNPIEILVCYSQSGPLPFPVSPMYADYLTKTIGLMPRDTIFLYWGSGSHERIKKMNTINEIFDELLSKV